MKHHKARFFEQANSSGVSCQLCGHLCVIKEGGRGICQVRENRGGQLYALAYGRLLTLSPDPIEKKPLSHFQPSTQSLSIASGGCNLHCAWCQNHSMSEMVRRDKGRIQGEYVAPEQVVDQAEKLGCASISYTYSEPTIHYEHNYDTGVEARKRGLKNVFVTNGLMTQGVACEAAKAFLDGANVDLKAMKEQTYKKHCKGPLQVVLDAIKTLVEQKVWVEVTTLVIPGLNDDPSELADAARFLRTVSPDIPWHLSRYHPANRWQKSPPTDVATLRRAREIGLEQGLRYVYTGNVWGDEGEHTYCPGCQTMVIKRHGFHSKPVAISSGHCIECGLQIAGVEMP